MTLTIIKVVVSNVNGQNEIFKITKIANGVLFFTKEMFFFFKKKRLFYSLMERNPIKITQMFIVAKFIKLLQTR